MTGVQTCALPIFNSLGERLNADGRYGAATAAAVQRFQRRNGLAADGSVGQATWEKLF